MGWSVHSGYTDQPDSLSRIQISLLKGKVLELQVWCKGRSVVPLVCSWVSSLFFCSVSRLSHAITNANAEGISLGYKGCLSFSPNGKADDLSRFKESINHRDQEGSACAYTISYSILTFNS